MRLTEQASARFFLGAKLVGQQLERNGSACEFVVGLEDEAHAAASDEPSELVTGVDCLPDERLGHFTNIITAGLAARGMLAKSHSAAQDGANPRCVRAPSPPSSALSLPPA